MQDKDKESTEWIQVGQSAAMAFPAVARAGWIAVRDRSSRDARQWGPEKGAEANHLPPPHHRPSEWRLAVGASDENDNWQVRRKRMVDIFHEGGWEYRCEPLALPDPAAAERTLNQLGKAGWELVEVVRGDGERDHTRVAVLKRKLFWS